MAQLLDAWPPMWTPAGRDRVDPSTWDRGDSVLSPVSLEALRDFCKSYPEGAGLGWDQFHPRLILQLLLECQMRVPRTLQAFEDNPF
eukprot:8699137-Pyramimonas_sp.AAC.1